MSLSLPRLVTAAALALGLTAPLGVSLASHAATTTAPYASSVAPDQQWPPGFPGLPQPPAPPNPMVFPDENTYVITAWDANQEALHTFSHQRPVFFLFGNIKCGGCKLMRQVMEEMAPAQKNFAIAYADTHGNQDLVQKYGIVGAPEVLLISRGTLITRTMGYPGERNTRTWVNESLAKIPTP